MPVKLKPPSEIKVQLGIEPNGRVQKFIANTCYKHMDKYVPMDNGDLRTIVTIHSDSITYEVPYASYQYYGMREDGSHVVSNYTTPGTGPYWDERMKSAELSTVIREVQKYINRGG